MFLMIEYLEWVSDTDRFSWLGSVDQTTTYIEGVILYYIILYIIILYIDGKDMVTING